MIAYNNVIQITKKDQNNKCFFDMCNNIAIVLKSMVITNTLSHENHLNPWRCEIEFAVINLIRKFKKMLNAEQIYSQVQRSCCPYFVDGYHPQASSDPWELQQIFLCSQVSCK